jgi:hypothetical protein
MRQLKQHSLLLLLMMGLVFQLNAFSQFLPDTTETYFIIQKGSHLFVGENPSDASAKIFTVTPSAETQRFSFVKTNVDGEYLIKHEADKYLQLIGNWNMGFTADTIGLDTLSVSDGYRYTILESSLEGYLQISPVNHPKGEAYVLGTDGNTDSSAIYSDKSGEVDNYLWEIVKTTDFAINDATLKSLSTDIGIFSSEFDPLEEAYEVSVPYGTTNINIDAVANNVSTSIALFDGLGNALSEDGIVNFTVDGIDVEILITAFDGTVTSYYLAIYVDKGASDPTLSAIDLSISAISPAYDTEVKAYTVIVPVGTSTVDLTATPNFPQATVTGNGSATLVDGTVTVNIGVTSQDGTATDSYTVTISEADGTNYALNLAGVSGAASHIDISGVNITSLPYTLEMWIMPEGAQSANSGLFFNRPSNTGLEYASSWQSADKIRFLTPEGQGEMYGSNSLSSSVAPNVWHHVAVVMTDSTRTVYLDGVASQEKVAAGTFSSIDFASGKTYIGWDSDVDGRTFKGLIDEVRVWNDALTVETLNDNRYEVLDGSETGLIAYYNFDLNAPSTAIDMSSNGNNGAIIGGTYVPSFARANLNLDSLAIEGANLYPAFAKNTYEFHTVLPLGTTSINVTASPNSSATSVAGTGNLSVADTGTIVITATAGEYSLDYTIHYQTDVNLALMHSYPFTDGTAKDVVGEADGTLMGTQGAIGSYITEGVYTSDSLGGYISFPGEEIAINNYTSITIEAYIMDNATINESANMMYNYFGSHNSSGYGENGFFFNSKSRAGISCGNWEPWTVEDGISGNDIRDDSMPHHVLSTLNNDSITLYLDGVFVGSAQLTNNNRIFNLSNQVAYLMKSGYLNDNTWLGSVYEYNIYAGIMDAQTIGLRAFNFPTDDVASDATLSNITLADTTITGFDPTYMAYTVRVPFGTTEAPVLAATAKVDGATAVITQATSLIDTAIISITSKDGGYTNTYSISYVVALAPSLATLSDLTIDGTTVAGFSAEVLDYLVQVKDANTLPTIAAVATNDYAYIDIVEASTLSDTTFITVTSEDSSTTQAYTVRYKLSSGVTSPEERQISIHPSISNGEFTLVTEGGLTVVTVYTLSGTVAKQLTTSSISTSFTLNGSQMYLVKVDNNNTSKMIKIVKR